MILLVCIISIFILIIVYSLIENRYLKTVQYTLRLDRKKHVHITPKHYQTEASITKKIHFVQLSDLHNCCYGKSNIALLEQVKACNPDVILITGDMITKYQAVKAEVYELFEQLGKLCPCIYSLGNHELKERNKDSIHFSEYIKTVQNYGIIVSDNELHRLNIKNTNFLFASYSSDLEQYKKLKVKKNSDVRIKEIPSADDDKIAVLLSHDPELVNHYVDTAYSVIFSGHLHGGIVRIPGWRGIISTRFVLFPSYDGGCYSLDDSHVMVVSRGLGSHTIKFRLFNRPELVHTVIEIEN